jgi:hypothetical protein
MFSFEDFSLCESYSDKLAYAGKHLEFLGSGSSRHVFALNDEKVLKVASNENGIIQNNVEKYYCDSKWERLSKVFDHDDDFMWVVSEKTIPVDDGAFEKISGISIDDLYVHLYHHATGIPLPEDLNNGFIAECMMGSFEMRAKTKDLPIVREIIGKSEEFGFNTSDIPRIEHWGLRKSKKENYLVINDFGRFDKRFRKYPSRNQDSVSPL